MAAEPGIAHFVLFSLFTAGTAAVIWVTSHSLLKRGLAAGVASAWLFTSSLVFVWHPWSTMSSDEVARATTEIRASGVPALYLGARVEGFDWNDYYLANDQVNIFYGECRESDPEAGCTDWDIEVHNRRHSLLAGDFIAGCKRLEPILGAPAVTLGGFNLDRPADNIGIFTEDTNVFIRFADDDMALEDKIALAKTLRPIGAPRARTLPPPADSLVADLGRLCGPPP